MAAGPGELALLKPDGWAGKRAQKAVVGSFVEVLRPAPIRDCTSAPAAGCAPAPPALPARCATLLGLPLGPAVAGHWARHALQRHLGFSHLHCVPVRHCSGGAPSSSCHVAGPPRSQLAQQPLTRPPRCCSAKCRARRTGCCLHVWPSNLPPGPQPALHPPPADAYGLVLRHEEGWSLVYSGDTQPSQQLVQVGAGPAGWPQRRHRAAVWVGAVAAILARI